MKISDKELQKIIHEELQEAVRKGEITEEELQQLQEANPIGFMGDVAKGLGTAAQAGIGKFKKERAKRLEKEKAAKAAGGVDPNRLTPELTRQILNKPGKNPPAAQGGRPAASSAPADAQADVQQVQRPIQDFQAAFKRFSDAVKNDNKIDVTSMIGNVLVQLPNGELNLVPASHRLASPAFNKAREEQASANVRGKIPPEAAKLGATNVKHPEATQSTKQPERPASGDNPTTGVRGIESSFEESKKPKSYNKLYENWRRYSKG